MRRVCLLPIAVTLLVGCSEGTKAEPLRRANSVPQPGVINPKDKPAPKTLYERLGREEGIQRLIAAALKEPATAAFADKLSPRRLSTYVVDVLGTGRPTIELNVTQEEWDTLLSSIRAAASEQGVAEVDRNELIDRLSRSKG